MEKNASTPNDGFTEKSVATFSADKKVLTIDSKIPMGDGGEITIKEVFSIVDGNLIIDSSNKSSWVTQAKKWLLTNNKFPGDSCFH